MMKLAGSKEDITESTDKAGSGAYPTAFAFPFGADRIKAREVISSVRQAPLSAVKVLALSRNSGGTAGVLRLVLMMGRAFFIVSHHKRKNTISLLPEGNRKDL